MGFLNSLTLPANPVAGVSRPAPLRAHQSARQVESARRKNLVNVVLMEVMRRQGIPSDWMACHTLHVPSRSGDEDRMLVQFVVQRGDDQLVAALHTFQDAFRREIARQDFSSRDWIAAISWEFQGDRDARFTRMPAPETWAS